MSRKSTIAENPLDAVVSTKATAVAARAAKQANEADEKERVTFHLRKGLVDRARNAVYWTPGLTLAALAEEAMADAIDKLERKNGEPFKHRSGQLKTGRPVKS